MLHSMWSNASKWEGIGGFGDYILWYFVPDAAYCLDVKCALLVSVVSQFSFPLETPFLLLRPLLQQLLLHDGFYFNLRCTNALRGRKSGLVNGQNPLILTFCR